MCRVARPHASTSTVSICRDTSSLLVSRTNGFAPFVPSRLCSRILSLISSSSAFFRIARRLIVRRSKSSRQGTTGRCLRVSSVRVGALTSAVLCSDRVAIAAEARVVETVNLVSDSEDEGHPARRVRRDPQGMQPPHAGPAPADAVTDTSSWLDVLAPQQLQSVLEEIDNVERSLSNPVPWQHHAFLANIYAYYPNASGPEQNFDRLSGTSITSGLQKSHPNATSAS